MKETWPNSIARKAIVEMSVYSARGGATDALHLDANENPYAPPPVVGASRYNRYPAQQPEKLVQRLADLYGVKPDHLMVGRGADEGIECLLRAFCEAGQDSILTCPPTFGYYKTCADIQGANVLEVPLNGEYAWDIPAVIDAAGDKSVKMVFLCSPNNPTGNSLTRDAMLEVCNALPQTLIVIDEAYIEFSDQESLADQIGIVRNLVVLRTLSKAYALAGVRTGALLADPSIIELLLKVLPPYPIGRPVETAILNALAPSAMAVHAQRREETLSERKRLAKALAKSEFVSSVYPSDANFVLLAIKNDEALFTKLRQFNVKIRDYRSTTGRVRVSVGSPDENTIALQAFGVSKQAKRSDRVGEVFRKTNETDISVRVNLDDVSQTKIQTGIGFYDHMLEQISKHGGMGLTLSCEGDLHIDAHHTVEDTALAFGAALKQALGDKAGIGRYGYVIPMDETQAQVAIDLSGRPAAVFRGEFPTDHVGEFPVEMCPHFFESLAQTLGAAIHIDVKGDNSHHMIEACFKGVGRALRPALGIVGSSTEIPSTKGTL
jgi:histidinol-phosphate aminotransferase/imidazoleglycerol-phosphate dehydratase/histidinol-phosphatase